MIGYLQAGGARELIRLSRHERAERERGIEAAGLVATRRVGAKRRVRRGGALRGKLRRCAVDRRSRRCRRVRGEPGGGRRDARRIGEGKFDGDRRAGDLPRQRLDAVAKAVLDPLEHEPVRCGQPQAAGVVGAAKRADPGGELLGGELALERGKTGGPGGRMRYGMHGNGQWMKERFCGVTRGFCDEPGTHCSRAFSGYPQPSSTRERRAGRAWSGVKVITRVEGTAPATPVKV